MVNLTLQLKNKKRGVCWGGGPHLSVDSNELSGVAFSPGREDDVPQFGPILFGTWIPKQ